MRSPERPWAKVYINPSPRCIEHGGHRSIADGLVQGKNLLLATDGKPHSTKAIKYAIELAKLTSSKLFIIYVVSPKNEAETEDLIKEGLDRLQDLKGLDEPRAMWRLPPSWRAALRTRRSSPPPSASRPEPSSSGPPARSALDRVLIGSVSEFVVRNSGCTVIVVK